MKYRKKPVVIEAITFDEFVQYGRDHGANIVNGMPWSFTYNGHAVTHENDERYLIPTLEGTHNFTPDDMLITGVKGEIYPCKIDIFMATYEPVEKSIETKTYSDGTTATGTPPLPDASPASPNKVTHSQILEKIKATDYVLMPDGRTTVCQLTMENGFTVLGFSACVDKANYDKAIGEKFAYEDAQNKVWPYEGYLLAETLHRAAQ